MDILLLDRTLMVMMYDTYDDDDDDLMYIPTKEPLTYRHCDAYTGNSCHIIFTLCAFLPLQMEMWFMNLRVTVLIAGGDHPVALPSILIHMDHAKVGREQVFQACCEG